MNFNLFKRKQSQNPMEAIGRVDEAIQDKMNRIARDIVWANHGIGGERCIKSSPAIAFIKIFDCHPVNHFTSQHCLDMSEQPLESADFCQN